MRLPPISLMIGVGVMLLAGLSQGVRAPSIAYAIGGLLPMAGIVFAVVWFAFLRRRKGQEAGLVFVWLFLAGLASAVPAVVVQQAQVETAMASVTSALDHYVAAERDIDTKAKASGTIGKVEGFVKRAMATYSNDARDLTAELAGAGVESMFTRSELGQADGIAKARFKLNQSRKIIAKYRALERSRFAAVRAEAAQLDIPVTERQRLQFGMERSFEKYAEDRERVWDLQLAAYDEYEALVDMLEKSRGAWVFQGEQIGFMRDADMRAFNAGVARVNAMGAEQERIKARMISTMRASLSGQSDT